jgi:signal transduction histidine kinase
MNRPSSRRWRITEIPLSLITLAILAGFTVGTFTLIPYIGFYFNPNTGEVTDVYAPGTSFLQSGDVLVKVGDVPFSAYKEDASLALFPSDLQKGDIVPLLIDRGGSPAKIDWVIPGMTPVGLKDRLFNIYWLAYIYWCFGMFVELFIRPRDVRWRLFIAANHITGLWLMFGAISSWHLMGASVLFRTFTWLILPVYLHLHWIFPQPLSRLPKVSGIILYSLAALASIGELIRKLPGNLFYLALILALGGSVVLLVLHFFLRPGQRRQIGLLVVSTILASLPAVMVGITGFTGDLPLSAPLALFSFALMPVMYLYLIFRSQLGMLEARANRFISAYIFLILISTFLVIVARFTTFLTQEMFVPVIVLLPMIISAVSIYRFPPFEAFIERNVFGIKLPYQRLPETFSGRIATCDDLPSLLALIENEVFPSLFVRQYAFLQSQDGVLSVLLAKDNPDQAFDFGLLSQKAGRYTPNVPSYNDWTRLILPLEVGDKTIGFWLLGRRDPDDFYPQVEIAILQSLANQTAIALSNILQSDRLREYYRTELDIVGEERNRIARDLHETVLNKLASMRNSLDQKTLPPGFLASYDELKKQLREIISNLRPPLLDQGLAFAIDDMMEDIRDSNEGITIILEIQSGEGRPPEKVEEHLFHIVHEACENALKHADASTLTLSGVISAERVALSIQDDGKGFDSGIELSTLTVGRHFGLTHMRERAHLVGGEIEIQSQPGRGTTVRILWMHKS